jgi:hypothetical protein
MYSLVDMQAKVSLRLGHPISSERLVEICLRYAAEHLDNIVQLAAQQLQLSPEKAERIIQQIESHKDIPYNPKAKFSNPDDEDINKF